VEELKEYLTKESQKQKKNLSDDENYQIYNLTKYK